jgi:hypothetical protein
LSTASKIASASVPLPEAKIAIFFIEKRSLVAE